MKNDNETRKKRETRGTAIALRALLAITAGALLLSCNNPFWAQSEQGQEGPRLQIVHVTGFYDNDFGDFLLWAGRTQRLRLDVYPSNATTQTVTWTSSDPGVLSIIGRPRSGAAVTDPVTEIEVSGRSVGTATLTASAIGEGGAEITASVAVEVRTLRLAYASAGSEHTIALTTNGELWAWGNSRRGQLGDGTTTGRDSPVRIGTATDWIAVSTSGEHNMGIRADGSLWTWGSNWGGMIGDGTQTNRNVPTRIGTDTNWATVSAGATHSMAIRTDGTLWAWGRNGDGQLGDGTTTGRDSPVQVGRATDWVAMSAGASHSVGIRANGSLWAWGRNFDGQLGNGVISAFGTPHPNPIRVGTATDWVAVSAGASHNMGIRANGSLWAWGNNSSGRLGDGTTENRFSPINVP